MEREKPSEGETRSLPRDRRSLPRDRRSLPRQLAIGAAVFCVVVAAILIAVWLIGDQGNLPFDYQGFD